MSNLVNELRQGSLSYDDYRWLAADELELLRKENERLRSVLQRVRRWGSPMIRGYIDGVLGRQVRGSDPLVDDTVGSVREQGAQE
jgi:hypothetical protein